MDYKIKQQPEDFVVEELPLFKNEGGEYTYWVLEKKNYNTLAAIKEVSKRLHVPLHLFGWAGNKDKNAVTRQYISIKKPRSAVEEINDGQLRLTYYGSGSERIYIGYLRGNRFTVTLRDLTDSDAAAICSNAQQLQHIPNYFDEQRFGETNVEVGRALIGHDFKKAAAIIYREEQSNPLASLRKVHNSVLSMYIHAYQSLLWNEALGGYIKAHDPSATKVPYSQGTFYFSSAQLPQLQLPVVGFAAEVKDEYTKSVLAKHSIKPRDFIIRQLPQITVEGTVRSAFAEVSNLAAAAHDDELNKGKKKVVLSFSLPKSSYATIVVKALSAL